MASLRFVSLNCHDFNVGKSSYLSDIVNMVSIHETRLSEFNCYRLGLISDNSVVFHTCSYAMEDKLRSGILSGRPFRGTAILIRKHFAHSGQSGN